MTRGETHQATNAFTEALSGTYEKVLVPAFFEPYAVDLAQRAADVGPRTVLEVAAGTGVLTRALAAALPDADIAATDLSPAMIAEAARTLASPRVRWEPADSQDLPFPDGSFDLVTSQFGIMFPPDKARAHREAHRVLAPGGRYLVATWGELARHEVNAAFVAAVERLVPDAAPTFLERIPHSYDDAAVIEGDLRTAGFDHVEIDDVVMTGHATSARDLTLGLIRGTPAGGDLPTDPDQLAETTELLVSAMTERFGDGPLTGSMSALVVTAVRQPVGRQ